MEEQKSDTSIILYEGSPLEKIAATGFLIKSPLKTLHTRLYLASDIIVGDYGVAGFLLVDSRPEERFEDYTDANLIGVSHDFEHTEHLPPKVRNNPLRLSHYIETDKGFKMARYFLIPSNVAEFFHKDKFLGEPIISKCYQDVNMPEWFDEEHSRPNEVLHGIYGERDVLLKSITQELTTKLKDIITESDINFWHRACVSFHPWSYYKHSVEIGESGIVAAIGNFDRMIQLVDKQGILPKRNLKREGAQVYRIALPPPEVS